MKVRMGFVSNSSSSSFIISKTKVTDEQLEKLKNHISESRKMGLSSKYDGLHFDEDTGDMWSIEVVGEIIRGSTDMTNFDMELFMKAIGIDPELAEWSD